MVGVLVNQAYGLSYQELPPYGTALGTPVLVVCSIGHFLYFWIPHKLRRDSKSQDVDLEADMITGSTRSAACDSWELSLEDGTVIQLWYSGKRHPRHSKVIGQVTDAPVILEHRCLTKNESGA